MMKFPRARIAAGGWLLACAALAAQQPRDAPRPLVAEGTASIVGTVVTSESNPRPLSRVVVSVNGPGLPLGQSAVTDERGAFAMSRLPPGPVTITAQRGGFLPANYGASRPGGPGMPVVLVSSQTLTVTLAMSKAAVLAGTIRDERGDSVPDLLVLAVDPRVPVDTQTLALTTGLTGRRTARTDVRGVFRLFDLRPGQYIVAAFPYEMTAPNLRHRRSDAEVDAVLARLQQRAQSGVTAGEVPAPLFTDSMDIPRPSGLAPVFYPGTSSLADAARITLAPGEERARLDFEMRPVPLASVEGVITSDGPLPSRLQLAIAPANWLPLVALTAGSPRLAVPPGSDGRFKFTNLIPGRHTIVARGNPAGPAMDPLLGATPRQAVGILYAVQDIEAAGTGVSGVELRLRPGGRVAGRIVLDLESSTPPNFGQIRVVVTPVLLPRSVTVIGETRIGHGFVQLRTIGVAADGSFEIADLAPGFYRLECQFSQGGSRLWLRSGTQRGRELLDAPFEISPGTTLAGVVLTITDRPSEISGTLQSATGLPAPEYQIIAFPADPALWTDGSRRIRSTRPTTAGMFSFADLPAGEYLLAALTETDPGEWQRPEFLRDVMPSAVKVTLGEGERKRQDLRIAR
jgi:hypothetical protein